MSVLSIFQGSKTEILAASIKSSHEAADTIQARAYHLTSLMTILKQMTTHELSTETVTEFAAKGTGIAD